MGDIHIFSKDGVLRHCRAEKKKEKLIFEGWQLLASIHGFNVSVSLKGGGVDTNLQDAIVEIAKDKEIMPPEEWIEKSIDRLQKLIVVEVKERLTKNGQI